MNPNPIPSREEQENPRSVFDDRELFGPEEAANLKVRSRLMNRLIAYVEERGLSQTEAAA